MTSEKRSEELSARLLEACKNGDLDTVESAASNGADLDAALDYGTPLMHAVDYPQIVRFLLDAGANAAGATKKHGMTPLHWAANGGVIEVMKLLIERGANVNVQATSGATPLHKACEFIRTNAVALLLEHGAAVDPQDEDGWTPTMFAAHWDERASEMLGHLLEAGADVDHQSKDGWTPVLLALKAEMLEQLLDAGADVDKAHSQLMFTPAMSTIIMGFQSAEMLQLLLKHRPDLSVVLEKPVVTYRPKGVLAKNIFGDVRKKVVKRVGKTVLEMARDKASKALLHEALG